MKIDELVSTAQDALTVRRVFAEPYQQDGVTVIPAADVRGGAGGGGGHDAEGQEGEGGGFGLRAHPAGVFVVDRGEVRWKPAVDVNRALSTAALVAVVYLYTRWRVERARSRAR